MRLSIKTMLLFIVFSIYLQGCVILELVVTTKDSNRTNTTKLEANLEVNDE